MTRTIFLLSVVCFAVGLFACSAALGQCYGAPGPESPYWKQGYGPRCIFPPVDSPCAVPCRESLPQVQAVPCAFKTACPSKRLPCYGVSYYWNPYALFRVR